jgi:hypothetical protein
MTLHLVDSGWGEKFADALRADSSKLRIICPFIKSRALEKLLSHNPSEVQVITRFNLADFAAGVSDVKALRKLLDYQAQVRGVRNLHAKLYIFGESRAIITSCNLTEAALDRNHELGVIVEDRATIAECLAYFDDLWNRAGNDLLPEYLGTWDSVIKDHQLRGGRPNDTSGLGDFGIDAGITDWPTERVPVIVTDAPQALVKLLGEGNSRLPLSFSTLAEVGGAECHWAVCYPANRRPRGVKDGAVIFMGRLTKEPNDVRVFGRAIGIAYREGRDDASQADIERRDWKGKWSRYIRVHHAEFVAGTLENGVSLNELMNALDSDSFASTQRNSARGIGNTNPRHAYRQQAAVQLSAQGFSWLRDRLQTAFQIHGKLSEDELNELDWPDSSIVPPPSN